ncbi:hypothetical protein ACP70R_030195 [Stipagrostis hirtigluma subsp. patula]
MAGVDGRSDLHVRVVSRRLVKASDSSIEPHVLTVSNLDLLPRTIPVAMFCVYPKPPAADFDAVVAGFEAGLPSLLDHFFPFAGRIATNPSSGLPEVHCHNQGAELVVGEATSVPLASLDYGNMSASLRRIQLPYAAADVALSVQVVSFACGGFTVAWCTNHVLVDGSALSLLVSAWSELARSGTLAVGSRPNHGRSVLRPRAPPSYSASLDEAFTPLDAERQVNVLTAKQSFVERLYYVEASDIARLREAASRGDGERATRVQAVSAYLWKALARVVGSADAHCRMGWFVDGRRRLTAPALRAATRGYVGNVTTFAVREASVEEVLRMPLPEVAAMVREAIAAPAYDEHFQELVDWVEEHKTERYVETATLGLGSPLLSVSAFASFPIDTDFGFGHAAMATPTSTPARLCSGFFQITAQPGVDGPWIVNAFVWPRLAAALESDEPRVLKPVTAEYLGFLPSQVRYSRL